MREREAGKGEKRKRNQRINYPAPRSYALRSKLCEYSRKQCRNCDFYDSRACTISFIRAICIFVCI